MTVFPKRNTQPSRAASSYPPEFWELVEPQSVPEHTVLMSDAISTPSIARGDRRVLVGGECDCRLVLVEAMVCEGTVCEPYGT
jgi:hypothetical protein